MQSYTLISCNSVESRVNLLAILQLIDPLKCKNLLNFPPFKLEMSISMVLPVLVKTDKMVDTSVEEVAAAVVVVVVVSVVVGEDFDWSKLHQQMKTRDRKLSK